MPDGVVGPRTDQSVRPILIRTLRRSFLVDPKWRDTPLAALSAAPDLEGPSPPPATIAIEPHGGHFRLVTPAGHITEGTLCDLATRTDAAILRQGFQAEARFFLLLPAAILRTPNGQKSAFFGERASGKTWLCLSLLEAGWRYEGDGWAVVNDRGITSLPRTIRIGSMPHHLSSAFRRRIESAPAFWYSAREKMLALDPRELNLGWEITSGPITQAYFLELNPGGFTGLRVLNAEEGFGRALALCRGKLSGQSLILLRRAISGSCVYRLRVGSPEYTADLLTKLSKAGG
jgi:hypothetical protein